MTNKIIAAVVSVSAIGLLVGAIGLSVYFKIADTKNAVGTSVLTFTSKQVGTNPVNGYFLTTNGTSSTWAAVVGGSGASIGQTFNVVGTAPNRYLISTTTSDSLVVNGSSTLNGGYYAPVGTTTNASSTNLFAQNLVFTSGTGTVLKIPTLKDNAGSAGANGSILTSNGTVDTWNATNTLGFLYSLNGLSGGSQTFSTSSNNTLGFGFSSAGTVHTLNIPSASSTVPQGLLTSSDWLNFYQKLSSTSIDTSAELAGLLIDETGTAGALVFSASPTFTGTTILANMIAASATIPISNGSSTFSTNLIYVNGTGTNATTTNLATTRALFTNLGACNGSTQKPIVDALGNWTCGTDAGGISDPFTHPTVDSKVYSATTTRLQISTTSTNRLLLGTTTDFGVNGLTPLLAVVDTSGTLDDNTPQIWTKSTSPTGGNADLRIDSPNPDIEFVENDQVAPAGKFEIAVQGDVFQIGNGRASANDSFENIVQFYRTASNPNDIVNIVASSTSATQNSITLDNSLSSAGAAPGFAWHTTPGNFYTARLSSAQGASGAASFLRFQVADAAKALQERARFDVNGNFGVGSSTPLSMLSVGNNGVGNLWVAGNATVTNATGTNMALSGSLNLTALATGCLTNTNGLVSSTGSACGSGGGITFGKSWEVVAGGTGSTNYLAPTTTIGIVVNASSSIISLDTRNATTSYATSTVHTSTSFIGTGSSTIRSLSVFAGTTTNATSSFLNATNAIHTYATSTNLVWTNATGTSLSLTRATTSAFAISGFTAGSLVYASSSGSLFQDNANLFWADTPHRLGLGTTTPAWQMQIASTVASVALSDSNAATNQKHWLITSQDGKLTMGTATDLFATSSAALSLVPGNGQLFVGTTTNANATGFAFEGTGYMHGLTASAGLQTGIVCLDSASQLINESVACVSSAKRFKKDIENLTVGLDEVMQLRPVSFKWKEDYNGTLQSNPNFNGTQYSLIADEVQQIDPHLVSVTTEETEFEGIKYPAGTVKGLADSNHWNALFVKSIQELNAKIEKGKRSAEENYQWIAIALLVLWNLRLQLKK